MVSKKKDKNAALPGYDFETTGYLGVIEDF